MTIIGFSTTYRPAILQPPNGRYVPIEVSGSVEMRQKALVPFVSFQVVDEYRRYQPRQRVAISAVPGKPKLFSFAFTFRLPASVASSDTSGRQFYIVVAARDPNGSTGRVLPVLVPNARSS